MCCASSVLRLWTVMGLRDLSFLPECLAAWQEPGIMRHLLKYPIGGMFANLARQEQSHFRGGMVITAIS